MAEAKNSDFVKDIPKKLVCKQVLEFDDIWGRLSVFLDLFWVSKWVHVGVGMWVLESFCASLMQISAPLSITEPILVILECFGRSQLLHLVASIGVPGAVVPLQSNSLSLQCFDIANA